MGVLSCDRAGCENIMCDRLSNEYGYLCSRCFDELVAAGPATDVAVFMGQKPPASNIWQHQLAASLELIFPLRH